MVHAPGVEETDFFDKRNQLVVLFLHLLISLHSFVKIACNFAFCLHDIIVEFKVSDILVALDSELSLIIHIFMHVFRHVSIAYCII